MNNHTRNPVVLIADDDPDDQLMISEAFKQRCENCHLRFFSNGEELMNYLDREAVLYGTDIDRQRPSLLLLDLNMPLKDGREVLVAIRTNSALSELPTVVFTTSKNEEDMAYCLANGAREYLVKPTRYSELLNLVQSLQAYWVNVEPTALEA